jgi:uncharacterized membrane protein
MASIVLFDTSEFSSRLPSAVFGILAIVLVYWIGRQLFDKRIGLVAALFVAILPFEIGWSRACRMYTLFQLVYLAALYLIYRGYENSADSDSSAKGIMAMIKSWRLNWFYLIAGGVVLGISYGVHQNAGLFVIAFSLYLFAGLMLVLFSDGPRAMFKTKYGAPLLAVIAVAVLAAVVPVTRNFIDYALTYQPKWAEVASAQNPWRIIRFFTQHSWIFSGLFLAGAIFSLKQSSRNRAGLYFLIQFLVPVLMFSFVFSYRKNDYIFHVYALYALMAAVGFVNVVDIVVTRLKDKAGESWLLQERGILVLLMALIWVPLTSEFRLGQKIPRLPDGHFNGAIYHNEWKSSTDYLGSKLDSADFVMSTLPLSTYYYLNRADYNLNISNSDLARVNNITGADGQTIDFYSGADVVDNSEMLAEVTSKYRGGWLIVDSYRFNNPVYVPETLNQHIKNNWQHVYTSERKTVAIYRWQSPHNLSTN